MEGSLKHLKKSTDELPYSARAQPYFGVVHVGRQLKCQSPRLLSIGRSDLSGTVLTGQKQNISTSSSKADQLLDHGAAHRPGKRGRLWAQPLDQHICVRGHPGRAHQSGTHHYQTFDYKGSRPTANRTTTTNSTTTATNNPSGSSNCRPNSNTNRWSQGHRPEICFI